MSEESVDFGDLKRRMEGALGSLKTEFASLRTGRASASILEAITVDAYGSQMPVPQVGTVSVPEPRLINIQVWDKTMVGPVEKAIRDANMGLNPVMDGQLLRIPIPELNEERRQELVKIAHKFAEQARVAIRQVRRDGMDHIKKAEKNDGLGEDDSRNLQDRIQKLTDEYVGRADEMLSTKEGEIMQV